MGYLWCCFEVTQDGCRCLVQIFMARPTNELIIGKDSCRALQLYVYLLAMSEGDAVWLCYLAAHHPELRDHCDSHQR